MAASSNRFVRVLRGTLKGIDITRRVVVDLLFIAVVVVVLVWIFRPRTPPVPQTAALVVDPQGTLVEQIPDPVRRAEAKLVGRPQPPVTRVRDVVWAVQTAKSDPHIKAIALDLDDFAGGSMPQLARVAKALKDFEAGGKPVIAYASNYTQGSYYLAAAASQAYLTSDQGIVGLLGLADYRNYYKDLIDKLRIDVHVFRVGKYKSYVEPYTRNDMSDAAKEENSQLLDTLWTHYIDTVAAARKRDAASFTSLANHLPDALQQTQGDTAELAVHDGLVDAVLPMPALRAKLAKLVGPGPDGSGYSRIGMGTYLKARQPGPRLANRSWDQVAIIVAQGDIVPGSAPQGTVGADSLTALLRRAANSDRVKAVVLDVDSPGGSALAADEILQAELALERTGKPLVVSMQGVAASGGYWISMAADRIFASPVTITGSIGIFGMFPTLERTADWIGVHRDGVETAPLADLGDPLRAMSPDAQKVFQLVINHGYALFTGNVAKYRKLPPTHVEAIAQGRVWAGTDARRIGLVDAFGGLHTAVKYAAGLAKLQGYGVVYLARQRSAGEEFMLRLADSPAADVVARRLFAGGEPPLLAAAQPLFGQLEAAFRLRDPRGMYAYCFCAAAAEIK